MDETAALADHVTATAFADLPADVIDHSKRAIRDYVGLTLHGSRHETADRVLAAFDALGRGTGATIVGHGAADPSRAALANGAFGHAINYDDTFESVVIHPSCTALPAALAAVETSDGTGRNLLTGYVVGLETTHRLGRSVAPAHWLAGWHATATIGVFGATAAAASVLGLSTEETRHALGLAASFAAGLKRNIPTMANAIHSGQAAAKGVEAALLARAGVDADDAILGGEYGFGRLAAGDGYDPRAITDPDRDWAVRDLGFKPYPSGVVTHAAMEALLTILERETLRNEDIQTVTATVDEDVMDTIDQHDPQTATEANVSYEFCLAAVLREGAPGVAAFSDDYVQAPDTRAAMAKVELDPREDPFGSSEAEASYGATITVETTDGTRYDHTITRAPGSPSNPLPNERLEAKFYACVESVLDRDAAERLEQAIHNLEEPGSLMTLLDTCIP